MIIFLESILVKKTTQLFLILLGTVAIRIAILLVSHKGSLKKNIVFLIKQETINTCLIASCFLFDKLILIHEIRMKIEVAVLFTSLVILDELISIFDGVGETPSSIFIIGLIKKVSYIISGKK